MNKEILGIDLDNIDILDTSNLSKLSSENKALSNQEEIDLSNIEIQPESIIANFNTTSWNDKIKEEPETIKPAITKSYISNSIKNKNGKFMSEFEVLAMIENVKQVFATKKDLSAEAKTKFETGLKSLRETLINLRSEPKNKDSKYEIALSQFDTEGVYFANAFIKNFRVKMIKIAPSIIQIAIIAKLQLDKDSLKFNVLEERKAMFGDTVTNYENNVVNTDKNVCTDWTHEIPVAEITFTIKEPTYDEYVVNKDHKATKDEPYKYLVLKLLKDQDSYFKIFTNTKSYGNIIIRRNFNLIIDLLYPSIAHATQTDQLAKDVFVTKLETQFKQLLLLVTATYLLANNKEDYNSYSVATKKAREKVYEDLNKELDQIYAKSMGQYQNVLIQINKKKTEIANYLVLTTTK